MTTERHCYTLLKSYFHFTFLIIINKALNEFTMKFKCIGAVTLTSIVLCIALQSVQETKAEGNETKHTSKSSSQKITKRAVTFAAGAYTAEKAAKMAKTVSSLNLRII